MTAPWRRTDTDDQVGVNRRRIRALEANCCTEDAVFFNWSYNGEDVFPTQAIRSIGGTDPDGYVLTAEGYVLGNLIAFCTVKVEPTAGWDPGTGTQYVITMPHVGTQEPYQPSFISLDNQVGPAYSYDLSATTYYDQILRISASNTILGGDTLEVIDRASGNFWGPTVPFSATNGDLLVYGSFWYLLYQSTQDPPPP